MEENLLSCTLALKYTDRRDSQVIWKKKCCKPWILIPSTSIKEILRSYSSQNTVKKDISSKSNKTGRVWNHSTIHVYKVHILILKFLVKISDAKTWWHHYNIIRSVLYVLQNHRRSPNYFEFSRHDITYIALNLNLLSATDGSNQTRRCN